jgi:hypothetical protein
MLLRRITKHVKNENWFAVFIDFLIVVVGVFIGIQVANWNEKNANQVALSKSLDRLEVEVQNNLDIIDKIVTKIANKSTDRKQAAIALRDCDDSKESRQAIIDSVDDLGSDIVPTFLDTTLNELSSQERFLSLLTPEFREQFNLFHYQINEEAQQLSLNFNLMWDEHVIKNDQIDVDFNKPVEGYSFYNSALANPVTVLCEDTSFRRQFNITVAFYEVIGLRLTNLKVQIQEFANVLNKEKKLH